MNYIKTFESFNTNEEIRLDRATWHSGKEDHPGAKGFKGSKNYAYVKRQGNKALRSNGKKYTKKFIQTGEEPNIEIKNPSGRTD